MNAEAEAAEIIRPDQLTHYDSPYLKRVIAGLLRVIAVERCVLAKGKLAELDRDAEMLSVEKGQLKDSLSSAERERDDLKVRFRVNMMRLRPELYNDEIERIVEGKAGDGR